MKATITRYVEIAPGETPASGWQTQIRYAAPSGQNRLACGPVRKTKSEALADIDKMMLGGVSYRHASYGFGIKSGTSWIGIPVLLLAGPAV